MEVVMAYIMVLSQQLFARYPQIWKWSWPTLWYYLNNCLQDIPNKSPYFSCMSCLVWLWNQVFYSRKEQRCSSVCGPAGDLIGKVKHVASAVYEIQSGSCFDSET